MTAVVSHLDHFQLYQLYLSLNLLPVQVGLMRVKTGLDNLRRYLLYLATHYFHFQATTLYPCLECDRCYLLPKAGGSDRLEISVEMRRSPRARKSSNSLAIPLPLTSICGDWDSCVRIRSILSLVWLKGRCLDSFFGHHQDYSLFPPFV